ncbi:MAG: LytTR family transcriptional regulator [Rhodobacteraceae bacterium]|nr:LytTR family transcriptional regulator [Paracoccaceae bacterium]
MTTALLLTPLHYVRGWSQWTITYLAILIVAVLSSALAEMYWHMLSDKEATSFASLFWTFFGFYGAARLFLLMVHEKAICFRTFETKWRENALEMVLPIPLRGDILSVSAKDHCVSIVTSRGTHVHRIGFSQALSRLNPQLGIKAHRSHWVASSAVRKVEVISGRNFVVLQNGMKIPISTSMVDVLSKLANRN